MKSNTKVYFKLILWFLALLKLITNFNQLRVLSYMGDMDTFFVHAYLTAASGGHVMFRLIILFQKQEWIDLNNELGHSNATWGKSS